MTVVRTRIVALVFAACAVVPASAWAQRVTNVTDGDTIVVDGVGKIHLLGIKHADEPAFQAGPSGPPPQPRHDPPTTPAPAAVSGRVKLTRDRPSRDLLRTLALGKTVRIEYEPLAGSRDRSAYLFLEDGTLLNAEMLKAGRARLDRSRQFSRLEEFQQLEDAARTAAVGIWIR